MMLMALTVRLRSSSSSWMRLIQFWIDALFAPPVFHLQQPLDAFGVLPLVVGLPDPLLEDAFHLCELFGVL
jgi:hypothetical protein